ncbi:MAG: SGNH/GDSL hydrolase family protein [Planctomycetaceae bacterium]
MIAIRCCCLFLAVGIAGARPSCGRGDESEQGFLLRDGDRVALLGGTLIEREQQFGYFETLLNVAHADLRVTFRNLGWSGDTVWGESRGLFEPQSGYERLLEQVRAADPTVLLIAYGNNEAFAGEPGLERFAAQYAKLLDDLHATQRRFVLLSPLEMEAGGVPGGLDAAEQHAADYNRDVDKYAAAIRTLADERGHAFIDQRLDQRNLRSTEEPLTSNGLHLTDAGYRETAGRLIDRLSPSAAPADFNWDTPPAAELRAAIIAKNQLYFHRWRPQNFTYLFGFRKYEQGQNAAEVPRFDPLIAAAEARIAELAKAAALTMQSPTSR